MGNKVNKSKKRSGWSFRKRNAERLHKVMKARLLQNEDFKDKENTHVASINVPVVDISLQNKIQSSNDAIREGQLQIEHFEDNEITVASVNIPVVGTSLQNKESPDERVSLPFDEIKKLQRLAAVTRIQDNPNHSTHHSPADSDEEDDYYTLEPEEKVEEFKISGNRVVDFMYLFEQLQEISHHNSPLGCNFNYLKLIGEKRKGFESTFKFVCKMCKAKLNLHNCKKPSNKKELDLNENVVSGFMTIGSGYAGLEEVSASLEIPSMSDHYYAKCHVRVCELWETAKEKCIEEAAKEEYDLAVRDGNVNADGVPMNTVVADGCWSKRSFKKKYNAMSGAAVIIGYKTKKVLYMAVKTSIV